jgi:serine/threonine-protein kinase
MPDRYDILDEIGRGGFGVVYRARDRKLSRTVALKMLREDHLRDEKLKKRFRREAQAVARLDHPHIVPVHDFGLDADTPFLVMPYVDGPTLGARIAATGALSPGETVRVGRQVAEALAYAHDEGVLHRDVKSANVLMDGERPRLTDFGIARLRGATGLTSSGEVMGTPAYMSPEQLEGREVGPRSDVYSLGVVLYECLSGRLPYEGENPVQIIYAMARGEREPLEEVAPGASSWLIEVVKRCLAEAPGDRYERAAALSKALSEGENGEPSPGALAEERPPGTERPTVAMPAAKEPVEVDPSWPEKLREALRHPKDVDELHLRAKNLSKVPEPVRQFTGLEILDLSFNPIVTLPPWIGELSELVMIFMQSTKLTTLPGRVGQLSKLFSLSLGGNKLTELPSSMARLLRLRKLDLGNNQLTELPEWVGQLRGLDSLNLSDNDLKRLPSSIGKLANLKGLRLKSNQLAELPESIGQLTNLNVLGLSGNPLSEEEKDRVGRLLPDTKIEF